MKFQLPKQHKYLYLHLYRFSTSSIYISLISRSFSSGGGAVTCRCNKLHIVLIRLAFHRFSFAMLAFAARLLLGLRQIPAHDMPRENNVPDVSSAETLFPNLLAQCCTTRSIVIADYYVLRLSDTRSHSNY